MAKTGRRSRLITYRHVFTELFYSSSLGLFFGYTCLKQAFRNVMRLNLIAIEEIPPVKLRIILQLSSLWLDARLASLIIDFVCINLIKSSEKRMAYRK